jgi:hypothetical protein
MDRMRVAAGGLEGREHRRGHGPARDHETLAEHKILEPALRLHHAVGGGIEVFHVGCPQQGSISHRYSRSENASMISRQSRRAAVRLEKPSASC